MPWDPRVHVGVAAIIVNEIGRLLMLERDGAHGSGQWSVPGGWIDYQETPEEAVLRELQEEVGCRGEYPVLLDIVSNTWPEPVDTAITIFYHLPYTFYTMAPTIREPDKIKQIRWMTRPQLKEVELFPPLASLLSKGTWFL